MTILFHTLNLRSAFIVLSRHIGLSDEERTALSDTLRVHFGKLALLFFILETGGVMIVDIFDAVFERQHRVTLAAAGSIDAA